MTLKFNSNHVHSFSISTTEANLPSLILFVFHSLKCLRLFTANLKYITLRKLAILKINLMLSPCKCWMNVIFAGFIFARFQICIPFKKVSQYHISFNSGQSTSRKVLCFLKQCNSSLKFIVLRPYLCNEIQDYLRLNTTKSSLRLSQNFLLSHKA